MISWDEVLWWVVQLLSSAGFSLPSREPELTFEENRLCSPDTLLALSLWFGCLPDRVASVVARRSLLGALPFPPFFLSNESSRLLDPSKLGQFGVVGLLGVFTLGLVFAACPLPSLRAFEAVRCLPRIFLFLLRKLSYVVRPHPPPDTD
jgi:hypothetical protein